MALYNKTIVQLKSEDYAQELYRFQGANSFNCINISGINNSGYLYFSNSLDHHEYFTLKRLKQFLNKELQELGLVLSLKNIQDDDTYHAITRLILNDEKIRDLYSYRLVYDRTYLDLIKDNYFYQDRKPYGAIERVDRRVFGGGYGVKDEWTELLKCLTIFTLSKEITREDLVLLLRNMKIKNKLNNKETIEFFFKNDMDYITNLSDFIKNDFTKYEIMNALEMILEKGLYSRDSELAKHPTRTIKEVVNHYQRTKEKTLRLLK